MNYLKNHPFAVEAHFNSSVILTFAVPKEQLKNKIPKYLQLDTFHEKYAFIAVAMVQTKSLRPKGFPKFMGNSFFLIGYRIFVRYTTKNGKNIRGLHIIKSETDKRKMKFLGNIFTHYNYTTTDISISNNVNIRTIKSKKSKFEIAIENMNEPIELPENSPFADWKEARRFAGPLPFTFTVNEKEKSVLIIEGVRQNWIPKPIKIKHFKFDFLESLHLENTVLANAFEINDIPYYWKKGKLELWK
ncbi:DUF2071 domain-containing protein [Rhizosphaericola mali]|uniref:DUF2071 domain-containing protein n=1 Tax=Rhizosphaericola mali TaxID=2545455 RepID=A0A5P2FXF2_9BACT|nr:DUF2071 domain-containing protein [Rhizosphaericola mali]QES87875.1 hypothetical protein E0W69_004090 [Rhizosphaericola mali]